MLKDSLKQNLDVAEPLVEIIKSHGLLLKKASEASIGGCFDSLTPFMICSARRTRLVSFL